MTHTIREERYQRHLRHPFQKKKATQNGHVKVCVVAEHGSQKLKIGLKSCN